MSEKENLEDRLRKNIHDGPFGPVEFQSYLEGEDGYELFISHLKVHEQYRRQGLGREAIQEAVQICVNSDLQVEKVSIDIMDKGGAEEFLRELGFENIRCHDGQTSGWASVERLITENS